MTDQQPTPGTQMTRAEQRAQREQYLLSPARQAMIEERKAINLMAAKIAGLSWGNALDLETRRMLAEYGRQRGIDVVTEIHILGNRIYKNAEYYINRAQPLILAGTIDLTYEFVNHDARLDTLAKSANPDAAQAARDESERRMWRRIAYNIPDAAPSAVIATLTIRRTGEKMEAAKWCGGGVRKGDPVGDGNPEATAVTRALRKVLKMAVGHDASIGAVVDPNETEVVAEIEDVIEDRRAAQAQVERDVRENQRKALANIHGQEYMPQDGIASVAPVAVDATASDPYADPPAREPVDPDDSRYYDGINDDLFGGSDPKQRDALREG